MLGHPTIVVQLSTRQSVNAFRAGLGNGASVVALGLDPSHFRTLAGIDALYVSLTRAERWGAGRFFRIPAPRFRQAMQTRKRGC